MIKINKAIAKALNKYIPTDKAKERYAYIKYDSTENTLTSTDGHGLCVVTLAPEDKLSDIDLYFKKLPEKDFLELEANVLLKTLSGKETLKNGNIALYTQPMFENNDYPETIRVAKNAVLDIAEPKRVSGVAINPDLFPDFHFRMELGTDELKPMVIKPAFASLLGQSSATDLTVIVMPIRATK